MSVAFPKPKFHYDYNLTQEKKNFKNFFQVRNIPNKKNDEIDLATWNIANLGVQKRTDKELKLIAHILSHFDIIAVQEINENLISFNKIMGYLPSRYKMMMTDTAGNQERLAVIYNNRIEPLQLFGELDYNPNGVVENNEYVIKPRKQKFTFQGKSIVTYFYNFSRNPFLSTWKVKNTNTSFMLASVHIYYGDDVEDSAQYKNRIAEVYYLANWAREQGKLKNTTKLYEPNIILLGDMNIPKMKSSDTIYTALKRKGIIPTEYSTEAGSTIQEFFSYDQIVFSNDQLKIVKINNQKATVVDYDNFIFKDLWNEVQNGTKTLTQFKAWTKYAISDHRPLFIRLKV